MAEVGLLAFCPHRPASLTGGAPWLPKRGGQGSHRWRFTPALTPDVLSSEDLDRRIDA